MPKERMMSCTYGGALMPSSPTAAFFKSRAAGSDWARGTCEECGYAPQAHESPIPAHLKGKTDHPFVQHKGRDTDEYYCGCYGWD